MEKHTGIELFLLDMEAYLIKKEGELIEWKNRAMQAQDFDEAIRLKEVQWAVQECIDKINPNRARTEIRMALVREVFNKPKGLTE